MNWLEKICMPIIPDQIEDIHHPEFRKAIPPKTPIIVYHGTSSAKLSRIIQHGSLDPAISGQAENKSYSDASEGIFVSIQATGFGGAELYAWHAAQHESDGDGSDPVILELEVPLEWIDTDPDDSAVVDGNRNQASKIQGRVLRSIDIKRIRQLQIKNNQLASRVPYQGENIFDRDKTEWMPIGKMMDLIQKTPGLSKEYQQMTKPTRPRGLSRCEPLPEYEQKVSDGLFMLYSIFNAGPDSNGMYDASLVWAYSNKNVLHGDAMSAVQSFFEYMKPGSFEYYNESAPDEYKPRVGESLMSFLRRSRNI